MGSVGTQDPWNGCEHIKIIMKQSKVIYFLKAVHCKYHFYWNMW
jgi:hypothetical protein